MENYKKSFYTKKMSNDFNFGIVQGKKAHWSYIYIFHAAAPYFHI